MAEKFHHKIHRHVTQYGLIYGPLAIVLMAGLVWYGVHLTWGVSPQNAAPTPPDRAENTAVATNAATQPDGLPDKILLNVPFTSQAPTGNWADDRQQNACEETSVLMATKWLKGESLGSAANAEQEILAISKMAEDMFGTYVDSSAADTLKLFRAYSGTQAGTLLYDVSIQDMKHELAAGHLIIAPMNGQALHNSNYTGAGPERHFLAIIGYDDKTGVFITNDEGTRKGRDYPYKYETLYAAMRDYPTGDHQAITSNRRAMIVIAKP